MPKQQSPAGDYDDDGDGDLGDFLDDDHAAIVQFANSYLDEDERDSFIDGLMERRGYTRVQSWAPPAPQKPNRGPLLGERGDDGGGQGGGQRARPRSGGRSPYFKR